MEEEEEEEEEEDLVNNRVLTFHLTQGHLTERTKHRQQSVSI